MMIFTHKSVKIHMLGNKVKNCPDYFKCVHCKGTALFLWDLSRNYVADQEGWEHCASFKILSDDDEKTDLWWSRR